jgi:hypothetical protein
MARIVPESPLLPTLLSVRTPHHAIALSGNERTHPRKFGGNLDRERRRRPSIPSFGNKAAILNGALSQTSGNLLGRCFSADHIDKFVYKIVCGYGRDGFRVCSW